VRARRGRRIGNSFERLVILLSAIAIVKPDRGHASSCIFAILCGIPKGKMKILAHEVNRITIFSSSVA
jgi:hypothetical protein